MLAITGAQHHDLIETYTQQDVALDKLFMDATAYSVRVMGPAHVEAVVEQACRTALAYRQPTHVMIPVDFQSQPAKDRSERNVAHHVSNIMARGGQLPDPEMLQRAADILNAAEKPFILAGRGAIGATEELLAVAERLQAPIGKPLLGKEAVPDQSPYTTGGVGLLGTKPSQEALESCDTLLIVGSTLSLHRILPEARQGQGGADRARSQARRTSLSGRRRPGRRQQARALRTAAAAQEERQRQFPRSKRRMR